MLDPLRHHAHYTGGKEGGAGGQTLIERFAEGVASGVGTVAFLVVGSA